MESDKMKESVSQLLLLLLTLLSLVDVHCQQTIPYISFMAQTLADHSYVDISQVGNDFSGSNTVQCHTDLATCCSGVQGTHRGDWYFPSGERLPFPRDDDIVENRDSQSVHLGRNNANEPNGLYRCDIETEAVHGNRTRETVYVGLYTSDGGDITIMGDAVIFDSDKLTLTCISTGGPATTVTWTRDSTTVTEGTETVLDDPETAQYTHTLNVTTGGEYTCTVENNKPSSDSATITLTDPPPPSDVTAVQDCLTSIRVTWTPPSPLGNTTGYRISYTGGGGSSGSVDVDGGNTNSHTLMGLTNGETYTILIVATSSYGLELGPPLSAGDIYLSGVFMNTDSNSSSTTTVTVFWRLLECVTATTYTISYFNTDTDCFTDSSTIPDIGSSETMYTLTGLEEGTEYSITVTATLTGGEGTLENTTTATTMAAVPSAPPSSVTVSVESSTVLSVQWGPVEPCIHQNGAITSYSVRYWAIVTSEGERKIEVASNDSMIITCGLTKETEYRVEVAAETSAGTGVYSDPITIETPDISLQVNVVVTAITTTSISLSWSVVGGSVARSEVVWRETDRGTEGSSGSLTGTSYTIDQLESTTIYTVTVRASNAAGFMTDSQPIIVSTASDVCLSEPIATRTGTETTAAVIGGALVTVVLITTAAIVIVVCLLKACRGHDSVPRTNRDPDVYLNRAYNVVVIENQEAEEQQRGGGEGNNSEYEYVMTENPPPPTSSTTITTGSGESLHEPL